MFYLLFEFHADGVGLLEEDGVPPEQVAERGELVAPPLAEAPHGQFSFPLRPLDCGRMETSGLGVVTTNIDTLYLSG